MVTKYKMIIECFDDYRCFVMLFPPVAVRILKGTQPTWASLNRKEMH